MATTNEQEQRNVETAHRLAEEVWTKGNVEILDDHYATDAVVHDSLSGGCQGPDGYREWVEQTRTAFPDLELELHEVMARDDLLTGHFTWRGTNEGPLENVGVEATGASVEVHGMVMAQFEDGKIVEEWNYSDYLSMLHQMGMLPAEASP